MVYQSFYPLTGPEALLTGGLEFVIVFVALWCFTYFLLKYIRSPDRIRTGRNLSWSIILLGLAGEYIAWIFADYFTVDLAKRDIITLYGYLSLSIGAFFSLIITEWVEKSRHRPFSIASGFLLIVVVLSLVLQERQTTILMTIGIPVAVAYFLYYFRTLSNMANHSRDVIRSIWAFLVSLVMILGGVILISDFWLPLVGMGPRIASGFIGIAGLNLFLASVEKMPDMGNFNWISKIRALLVIHENGIPLFSRVWNGGVVTPSEDLLSGVLSSVQTVLQEMMGREKVNVVTLKGKTLLFEHRKHLTCVVIADEPLASLKIRLKQFADQFSSLFSSVLESWNNNLDVFLPAEAVANSLFVPQ